MLQPAGDEKLASEYEQFMKMVCTDIPLPTVTNVAKEYSPKKNPIKTASPHSYHEFNIECNLVEDNTSIEIPLKETFNKETNKIETLEGSLNSAECEESTVSTDCQIQINENNMRVEHTNDNNETEDTKSVPSDWENVRIKVERVSDENTELREVKKKKKQKKVISSSDTSSTSSSDSEKEKKKKKRKRKSNPSSSDSDSTDSSSSSSSNSSSSDEKRKRKRKKKKMGKKRKKAKRGARMKKKRRRKTSTDSSSSELDERIKKKKKIKKKVKEVQQFDEKSINNGDINKVLPKSPVTASPSNGTKILHVVTPTRKVKDETAIEEKKGVNQESTHEWEIDSMIVTQQNDSDMSSQDVHSGEVRKINSSEKDKRRKKRKRSRDNVEQNKDRLSKDNQERIYSENEKTDEELETKKKKRKEKNVRCSTEFLADWEKESERITQQIIQNEVMLSKKMEKQKKEKWGETDFDILNVPSLTQLEKEVCRKQLLADDWEVDSLEAISDLTMSKRKSSQSITSKKTEKEVRYDKKTDTYIAIEKESAREMKKRQERMCAIRIWEEEQEEGEREEMMLLEQKNKCKKDDWDIEGQSFLCKTDEEVEIRKIDDVKVEKEWNKLEENTNTTKEDSTKLMMKLEPNVSKRVRKSRWDMSSQSEDKLKDKDIWEDEYAEWSKIDKCEQEIEKTDKGDSRTTDCSKSSAKSDLIDFYPRKQHARESERSWTSEEIASKSVQTKKEEDPSKSLISVNEETASTKKEHQISDQLKDILDLNIKFKEKTMALYSPSSPALSQKSQVYFLFMHEIILYNY